MANIKKIVLAATAVTAVAAGSSAFTAGMTGSGVLAVQTAGYGAATVTGAEATNITYNYGTDHATITWVEVTFTGDLDGVAGPGAGTTTGYTFDVKWMDATLVTPVVLASAATGGVGTVLPATYTGAPTPGTTTVRFTPNAAVTTAAFKTFSVTVTGPPIVP
jgi:hypothetical protein